MRQVSYTLRSIFRTLGFTIPVTKDEFLKALRKDGHDNYKGSVIEPASTLQQTTKQTDNLSDSTRLATDALCRKPAQKKDQQQTENNDTKKRIHPHSWFFRLRSQLHLLTEKEKEDARQRPSQYIRN